MNRQLRAWCFPLMSFIQLSLKKKGQLRTESPGGPGQSFLTICWGWAAFPFSFTHYCFLPISLYDKPNVLQFPTAHGIPECSCVLVVSSLPADRVAVWNLIWLRKHAAGPSVPYTRRGKTKPTVNREWLMVSCPVELARWATVHLFSQA